MQEFRKHVAWQPLVSDGRDVHQKPRALAPQMVPNADKEKSDYLTLVRQMSPQEVGQGSRMRLNLQAAALVIRMILDVCQSPHAFLLPADSAGREDLQCPVKILLYITRRGYNLSHNSYCSYLASVAFRAGIDVTMAEIKQALGTLSPRRMLAPLFLSLAHSPVLLFNDKVKYTATRFASISQLYEVLVLSYHGVSETHDCPFSVGGPWAKVYIGFSPVTL